VTGRWLVASALGTITLATAATLCLSGCANLGYYWQSATGHLKVLQAAKPVQEWIDDGATPQRLKERLALSQRIRATPPPSCSCPTTPATRATPTCTAAP
jgi:predicted aminopeptidase